MTEMTYRNLAPRHKDSSILGDWWHSVDRWSLGAVVGLLAIGLVLSLAASPPLAYKNDLWTYHYVARHTVFMVLSFGILASISMCSVQVVRRMGVLLFLAFWLATALLPILGTDFGKGAFRWYSLGFLSLQPSEFLKTGFVIAMAWLMAGSFEKNGPPGLSISAIVAVMIAAMLAMQPDFGQAMLVLGVWAAMIFVAGARVWVLLGLGGFIAVGGWLAYHNSEHFARRINGYWTEQLDPHTQLAYAQSAIREGGLFGVGVAQGQVKWTLPDAHTDFIIAVSAEEFGLVFTLAIVAVFLFITLRALARLAEERDVFVRLAGSGIAVLFGLQAFVNMSVAIRLLPAKGMTLPFISYGGSSMMAAALAMGALLALTRTRPHDAAADLRNAL
ncbi:cell division protein FtsW [Rhodobacteraceae bacterium NNCM2]|nr:cell division protein FtsW [Coraliihabitans acroporae]